MRSWRPSAGSRNRRPSGLQNCRGSTMTIGTEHEFSINDPQFSPLPVSDAIIRSICGRYSDEILFGDVKLGKELQKTVIEMVPRTHSDSLTVLEEQLMRGVRKFSHIFRDRYQ